MSKSPFWGIVTHVLLPIYILQALNMKTCLNQLTTSRMTYFISQADAGNRFSQDWKVGRGFEKITVNGPGRRKLGEEEISGID